MTSTNTDPNRVPFGLDSSRAWLDLRFTGIENPHILLAGGTQTGKTSLQILIAAVAASRGNIVPIFDPKLRFSRAFRHPETGEPLPHVPVYRDADEFVAAKEWEGMLSLVTAEQQGRYRADEQAKSDILGDALRFPNVLVVMDELGNLLDFADKEWNRRRPDGYKGETPIREMIHGLARMGAEARVIGCFANQSASEKEMPAGTRTRTLCGQKIFLGPISEGRQWQMLAGDGVLRPDIPDKQKGAGAVVYGDGKPIRFQAGFIDWKNDPAAIYNLAAQGLPMLREHGHVDERDRLILAGVPVPPPGTMAYHVSENGLDLLRQTEPSEVPVSAVSAGEQSRQLQPAQRDTDTATQEPDYCMQQALLIVGLDAAADFCGMSVPNFRKIRSLHPIEGEIKAYEKNKPAWEEADLKTWAMRHAEHRGRRIDGEQKRGA